MFDSRKYVSHVPAVLFRIYQGTIMSTSKNGDKEASNHRTNSITILVMFRRLLHVRSISNFQKDGGFWLNLTFNIFA